MAEQNNKLHNKNFNDELPISETEARLYNDPNEHPQAHNCNLTFKAKQKDKSKINKNVRNN